MPGRELLHDAFEALVGGFDPITPLKPHLGDGFARLVARMQAAVDLRYDLPPWDEQSQARHKHADRLAAASEAHFVAGWDRAAMREHLGFSLAPAATDPMRCEHRPAWEPWPPKIAEQRFLHELHALAPAKGSKEQSAEPRTGRHRSDAFCDNGQS